MSSTSQSQEKASASLVVSPDSSASRTSGARVTARAAACTGTATGPRDARARRRTSARRRHARGRWPGAGGPRGRGAAGPGPSLAPLPKRGMGHGGTAGRRPRVGVSTLTTRRDCEPSDRRISERAGGSSATADAVGVAAVGGARRAGSRSGAPMAMRAGRRGAVPRGVPVVCGRPPRRARVTCFDKYAKYIHSRSASVSALGLCSLKTQCKTVKTEQLSRSGLRVSRTARSWDMGTVGT